MPDLPKKNKLAQNLEEGRNIKGLIGYVETELIDEEDNPILMKVKCIRVEAGSNGKSCGVRVVATPVSGVGEFYCDPCQWSDSPTKYKTQREYNNRVRAANEAKSELLNGNLITSQKRELLDLAKEIGVHEELRIECEELFKLDPDKTAYDRLLVKATKSEVSKIATWVYAKKYKVKERDMSSNRYY